MDIIGSLDDVAGCCHFMAMHISAALNWFQTIPSPGVWSLRLQWWCRFPSRIPLPQTCHVIAGNGISAEFVSRFLKMLISWAWSFNKIAPSVDFMKQNNSRIRIVKPKVGLGLEARQKTFSFILHSLLLFVAKPILVHFKAILLFFLVLLLLLYFESASLFYKLSPCFNHKSQESLRQYVIIFGRIVLISTLFFP